MTIYDALAVKRDMEQTFPECHVETLAPIGTHELEPAITLRFKLYGTPPYEPYHFDEIVSDEFMWRQHRKREIKAEVAAKMTRYTQPGEAA
jgi:hypothetical protein